ncbi:MAG: TIGR04219 family outer membrane beta-barrel protein [Desulfobacterales bacterium]|nr:TIGR04219 family outer membrane beta-barrel protein [Desulfobacterales bacterium]
MKKIIFVICFTVVLATAPVARAIGFELALGMWNQAPTGDVSYKSTSSIDVLDLDKELKYDSQWRVNGRLKLDMPLLIPNVYLMATPLSFEESTTRGTAFKFGNQTFSANTTFDSKVTLNHYDVALYYGIPFLSLATAYMLNVDVGLNLRYLDIKAEIHQGSLSESKSFTKPIPMVFLGAQFTPFKRFALETELRGITYSGNSYFSFIGRLRYNIFAGLFATGGYRLDMIDVNDSGVDLETSLGGAFFEVGFEL